MNRAQQAAEKRYPSYRTVGFSGAEDRQAAFIEGTNWALPETPDPAVIEALAKHLALAGQDWTHSRHACDDDGHETEHTNWTAWLDDAGYAYAALRKAVFGD